MCELGEHFDIAFFLCCLHTILMMRCGANEVIKEHKNVLFFLLMEFNLSLFSLSHFHNNFWWIFRSFQTSHTLLMMENIFHPAMKLFFNEFIDDIIQFKFCISWKLKNFIFLWRIQQWISFSLKNANELSRLKNGNEEQEKKI